MNPIDPMGTHAQNPYFDTVTAAQIQAALYHGKQTQQQAETLIHQVNAQLAIVGDEADPRRQLALCHALLREVATRATGLRASARQVVGLVGDLDPTATKQPTDDSQPPALPTPKQSQGIARDQENERRIYSPIYPAGHVNVDAGKAALLGIFEIAALTATPRPDASGTPHLQTDSAGRRAAINQIDQAANSLGEWINTVGLLLACGGERVSSDGHDAAGWAIAGMGELLGELHRARGALCLPTMGTAAVRQAIAAPQQNREVAP